MDAGHSVDDVFGLILTSSISIQIPPGAIFTLPLYSDLLLYIIKFN